MRVTRVERRANRWPHASVCVQLRDEYVEKVRYSKRCRCVSPRVQDSIPYLMVALEYNGSKDQLKCVVMRFNVANNVPGSS